MSLGVNPGELVEVPTAAEYADLGTSPWSYKRAEGPSIRSLALTTNLPDTRSASASTQFKNPPRMDQNKEKPNVSSNVRGLACQ